MSKSLNCHERKYCVTRKELLAVVNALKHFHSYLYGQEVLLRTDNAAVSWMCSLKKPTGQVARWLEELGTYNLMVIHRQGRKHLNADALSRNPCKACLRQKVEQELGDSSDEEGNQMVSEDSSPQADIFTEFNQAVTRSHMNQPSEPLVSLEGWTLPEIRQKQLADANVGILLAAKEEGKKPEWKEISHMSSTIKTLWRHWNRLNVYSGVLYRLWMEDDESRQQMIVPQSLKDDILKYYHDIPSSAHLGREKTLEKVKFSFY
ncbi:uncharacterized protein [Haliotis cracherodii]|uniref:uncharacterized protein n=1 Tax=Haliotis cracherodii TaxID=6455 RepID=UPI0039ED7DAA